MGVISRIVNVGMRLRAAGSAVTGMTRVLAGTNVPIGTSQDAHGRSLSDIADRYVDRPTPGFRSFLDSLNNLPGPIVVVSTTVMIGFAMVNPDAFAARMNGLNQVPEPLWWLMGGLVSFYFGAREIRQARLRALIEALAAAVLPTSVAGGEPAPPRDLASATNGVPVPDTFADNAALRDWVALRG